MPARDAFAFNAKLRRATTPVACADLFRGAIAAFGFDTFACGELDLADRDRSVFYLIDWPDRWTQFYMLSGMIDRDPIVDGLGEHSEPFTWSELRADRKLSKAGRQALDMSSAEGWVEGLVVPLPRSSCRIGLISMVGHRAIEPATRTYLCLISICLHDHVRTLVARHGFPVPPAGLTPREIECVALVARGMTDDRIAETMGIAPSTAHEFVEKAKRRLKARSRAELIALAVSLAIIDM